MDTIGATSRQRLGLPKLSTRNLAAGFVGAAGAGLLAAGPAHALLGHRSQYFGSAGGVGGKCMLRGAYSNGPWRSPSYMSNYGIASALCTGGGAGVACIGENSSHGGHYAGVHCATTRGRSIRSPSIPIPRGKTVFDAVSLPSNQQTSNHLVEGVSRRSFVHY